MKRMQSFTSVMPGEVFSCVGCHEHRTATPAGQLSRDLLALRRPPSKIESFEGFPDVLDFQRDIQPILDKHCVECHNQRRPDGHVILAGDLGPDWSHSYFSLLAAIQRGKAELDKRPRYGTAGFRPNHQYIREMNRYGVLPESFELSQQPLDVFQADNAYWKTFWHRPPN
jgi:hypothetical protein